VAARATRDSGGGDRLAGAGARRSSRRPLVALAWRTAPASRRLHLAHAEHPQLLGRRLVPHCRRSWLSPDPRTPERPRLLPAVPDRAPRAERARPLLSDKRAPGCERRVRGRDRRLLRGQPAAVAPRHGKDECLARVAL